MALVEQEQNPKEVAASSSIERELKLFCREPGVQKLMVAEVLAA